MREFEGFIFPNGRIVAIPEEEYMATIEAGKEILVFCGGWAGGYARAFGADKEQEFMSLIKRVTWSIRMMSWIRPLRQKI